MHQENAAMGSKKSKQEFRPRSIKLVPTKERLTDAVGLGAMVEVFDQSSLPAEFVKCLPGRTSPNSYGSYRLSLIQISSFLYGHDSLDDLEEFRTDGALEAIMRGETVAPRTMGDYLRDFSVENLSRMNLFLPQMSRRIREQMAAVSAPRL